MKVILTVVLVSAISCTFLSAQEKRQYTTARIDATNLIIDGNPKEGIWDQLDWQSNFTQFEPSEGKQPSQKTTFALGYDDNFIYVAFKAFDSAPDSIVQRLTRRDDIDGDFLGLQFDSYYDQRTAFSFVVSAAGVKMDFIVSNDGENEDDSWNPTWWVKTSKDHEGWYCEMKIPFTQLRFKKEGNPIWGIQVARNIFRKDEMNLWQAASRTLNGWVSQYGVLDGLKEINAKRSFEISPYLVLRTDRFEKVEGDPFKYKGFKNMMDAGVDGKIGLSSPFLL